MAVGPISRTTRIIIIVEFVLLAYMLYVLSTSLYKSYQVDNFIKSAEQENARLEKENTLLAEDYEYYRSDRYKEKIAKQNFGLVRPGEQVIILLPDSTTPKNPESENTTIMTRQYYENLSNARKWFLFFFDRERFSVGY